MHRTGLDVPLNSRSRVFGTLAFACGGGRNSAALVAVLGARDPSHLSGAFSTGFVAAAVLPLPLSPLVPAREVAQTAPNCATSQQCCHAADTRP